MSVENHFPISRAFWIGRQILPLRRNIDGGGKALATLPPPCPLFQHLTYPAPRTPLSMNRWSISRYLGRVAWSWGARAPSMPPMMPF